MSIEAAAVTLTPPLRLKWRSASSLSLAVAGNDSLYGFTPSGKIVALNALTGAQRWVTSGTFVASRLALQGSRLFAYRVGEGLVYIDDAGTAAVERVALSFGSSSTTNMSTPIIDGRLVYMAVNQGLYATHQDRGLQFGMVLSEVVPHSVGLVAQRDIVVVDGKGVPGRYRIGEKSFQSVWTGVPNGVDAGQSQRVFAVAGNRIIVGVGADTVGYDLATGRLAWRLGNVPAQALAVAGEIVYVAFHGASLWAIRASDGKVLWQRQYLYNLAIQREYGLVAAGEYLYFGGVLQGNPDGSVLLAVRAADGAFAWLSRSAVQPWAGGIPILDGARLYAYGPQYTGAFQTLENRPRVRPEHIEVSPRPLRGASSSFGTGRVQVNLPVSAKVSVTAYRETQGLGKQIVNGAAWSAGSHETTWSVAGTGGFTDVNQFGYILVDVTEDSGATYVQSVLVPVNTFPDVLWHWARNNIEVMAYHKFVNGYLDQTFRPNGLVTRAESSTIVAKTLGLEGPSQGFRTKFTDISSHWSKNYVMALEERGVIGGFAEPNGTYTFRPNLNMTRGQEARILVKAYNIPAAPPDFTSRFKDVAGHWAAPDIKALEAGGYVSGFQEADGTFTYRPEQELTRAELCTVVVRIRDLAR